MIEKRVISTISWSPVVPVEVLRQERSRLPHTAGVYVFTNYASGLEKNFGVLYVGKSKNLAKRVPSYLVDPGEISIFSLRSAIPKLNSSLRHVGKVKLLVEIQQKYRDAKVGTSFIWVRWAIAANPATLEKKLIEYLQPAFNERLR